MKLIEQSFPIAVQILLAKTPDELAAAKLQCEEHATTLHERRATLAKTQDAQLEFLFDMTLLKFLNTLVMYQANTLGVPVEHKEFISNCNLLAMSQKVGLNTNTMRMIRSLIKITAMIFTFNDMDIAIDDAIIRNKSLEIMLALYQFKEIYTATADEENHGLTTDIYNDTKTCVNHVLQSDTIKDHAPQTLMQEYISIIGNIFIAKLLNYRDANVQQSESDRNNVLAIDTLLCRLNLHKHQTLRTILSRYIAGTALSMHNYLRDKVYFESGKKSVVSILIDANSNHFQVISKYKTIIDFLFANMEAEYQRLYLLSNLRFDVNKSFDIEKLQQCIDHGTSFLLFEAKLIKANLNSLHIINSETELDRLNFLITLTASIACQATTDNNVKMQMLEIMRDFKVSEIPLDWIKSMQNADMISNLLIARFKMQIKNGDNPTNTAIYDLNVLLEHLASMKESRHFMRRLILNYYIQCNPCLQEQQSNESLALANKIQPLLAEKAAHPVQVFLLKEMAGEISEDAKVSIYKSFMEQLRARQFDEKNIHSLELLFRNIFNLAQQSLSKNTLTHNLASYICLMVQEFLMVNTINISGYLTQDVNRDVNFPLLDVDLNVEAACTYPDSKNYIANLFTIAQQIDAACEQETLLQINAQLNARREELTSFESEFDDIFGKDYQEQEQYQTEVHALEKDVVTLMKALTLSKLKSPEAHAELEILSKYKKIVETSKYRSSLDYIRVYIGLMVGFIEFRDADMANSSHAELLKKANTLLSSTFLAMALPATNHDIDYMKNIPMAFLSQVRSDFCILRPTDQEAVTPGEKHLYTQMELVVAKLLVVREKFDAEPTKDAIDALEKRYNIGYMDILLSSFNLLKHADIRKCYNKVKRDTLKIEPDKSMQHMHPLCAQVATSRSNQDTNEQLLQLADIAIHNIYECIYAYNAISVVDTDDKSSYLALQKSIVLQMNFIFKDSALLLMRCMSLFSKKMEFLNKFDHLELAMSTAYSTLTEDEKSQWMKPQSVCSTYTMTTIDSEAIQEAITTAFNKEVCNKLDYDTALLKITNLFEKYEDMLTGIDKQHSQKMHVQSMTDIYLNLLMQTETPAQYEALIKSELHKRICSLPQADYQKPARNLLIYVTKYLSRDQADCFDANVLNEHETTECLVMLDDFCNSFAKARKAFKNADDDHRSESKPVYMSSENFIFFRDVAALIFARAKTFTSTNALANKINQSVISEIERHYAWILIKSSQDLQPERLGLNVFSFKPVSVVKPSFVADIKPSAHASKKPAVKSKKKGVSKANHTDHQELKIDFASICERFDGDYREAAFHFQHLLNHASHRIRNNQALKLKAIMGLAEALTHISDKPGYQNLLSTLLLQVNLVLKLQAPETAEQVFGDYYPKFQKWIEPHLPKESEKVVKVRVLVKRETKDSKHTTKQSPLIPASPAKQRIEKPVAVRKLFVPHADDVFHHFRKTIPLHSITVTENEKRLLKYLHAQGTHPLIAGEAVRNTIRRIPYVSLQAVCFLASKELKELLDCHLAELRIASVCESHNQVVVVFAADKYEALTINCLSPEDKARSLYDYAYAAGVGVEIFYCLHTQNIIDPCHLYTRIKNRVLDTAKLFDNKIKIGDLFAANPEKMLTAVIDESRCQFNGIFLECSALRNLIIPLNYLLHPGHTKQKISFTTFDNLFIKGSANYEMLHLAYDVMNYLFPVFRRSVHDSMLINRACTLANERYHKWVNKEQLTLRIHDDVNEEVLFEFRVAFITDLLRDKFLATHYLGRYIVEGRMFHHQSLGDDIMDFLAQCNMPYDDKLLIALEKRWAGEVSNLQQRICN